VQISKAEVLLRGSRLIVRHAVPHHRDFWELHFLGEPAQISQKLYQTITSLQKKGNLFLFLSNCGVMVRTTSDKSF